MNASEWRSGGYLQNGEENLPNSKIRLSNSKNRKDLHSGSWYIDYKITYPKKDLTMINKDKLNVKVKVLPERHVAYIRHIGPYKNKYLDKAFDRLFIWAEHIGIIENPAQTELLCIYYDDPYNLRTLKSFYR